MPGERTNILPFQVKKEEIIISKVQVDSVHIH